jgi:hypothetical protein
LRAKGGPAESVLRWPSASPHKRQRSAPEKYPLPCRERNIIHFGGWGISNVSQLAPYVGTSANGSIMLNLTSTSHLTLEGIPGGLQNSWFNFNA